ncbi:hypothetical protein ANCCAN_28887 [Ancylostoma caninum]|uniref:Uncharacterized protein n=1 Tax=Ancylostoma caninum TaxID=29170 RepID=A0A368EZZ5_ANCCA|nr:hypothetical protein ANCCAN_28887 [Ancylostoma caninum]
MYKRKDNTSFRTGDFPMFCREHSNLLRVHCGEMFRRRTRRRGVLSGAHGVQKLVHTI